MTANSLRLIAGALDHYASGNPGKSPPEEIALVQEWAMYFWAEAAEAERRIKRAKKGKA
jgi:hypothetical protein